MQQNERIQAIKLKKTDHRPPPSLTVEEISVIISEPDSQTAARHIIWSDLGGENPELRGLNTPPKMLTHQNPLTPKSAPEAYGYLAQGRMPLGDISHILMRPGLGCGKKTIRPFYSTV